MEEPIYAEEYRLYVYDVYRKMLKLETVPDPVIRAKLQEMQIRYLSTKNRVAEKLQS